MNARKRAMALAGFDEAIRHLNSGIHHLRESFQESPAMEREWKITTETIAQVCMAVDEGRAPVSAGLSAISAMLGEMAKDAKRCEDRSRGGVCGHGKALLFSFTFPRAVSIVAAHFGCSLKRGKAFE